MNLLRERMSLMAIRYQLILKAYYTLTFSKRLTYRSDQNILEKALLMARDVGEPSTGNQRGQKKSQALDSPTHDNADQYVNSM